MPTRPKQTRKRRAAVARRVNSGRDPNKRARRAEAPVFETLEQQADRLAVLDPLDAEPSNTYSPEDMDS